MKTSQIVLSMIFLIAGAFTIMKWPGQSPLLVFGIFGVSVLMMLRSIKEALNFRIVNRRLEEESILDIDLNRHDRIESENTIKLFVSIALLLASTYLLFRFMFWRSWIVIQYVTLAVGVYLAYKFIENKDNNRKLILLEMKQHWLPTIITFFAVIMAIVPYSKFIHWNEFENKNVITRAKDPCSGVGRYLWALEREGDFEEIKRFRKDMEGICFFTE